MSHLGIVGSRTFVDYGRLSTVIDHFLKNHEIDMIISGGACGADALAERYAYEHNIKIIKYLPQWNVYGKRAGAVRNQLIVDNSNYIIAFWDGDSPGTKITIDMAKKAKIPITIINV